jgi:tetratricopeptide (TPR) repeat protein
MNDTYSTLKRVKTDGSGRFSFYGLSSGTFVIKVSPYGTNYLEETQSATIINNNIGGSTSSDSIYLDIYLKLDKRKTNNEFQPASAVFIQEVPAAAKDYYKKALVQLEKSKQANLGLENLKKALEIFPDYYDALNRLGFEHVRQNQYFEALPYLIKAVQLNQRSFSSFYALGIAALNLKQMKEATEAFRLATVINSQSVFAQFQYGRALRISGNYKEAEQALLKAKSLDKDLALPELYWQLGLLYEKHGRYKEAADELETYVKIQSDIPNLQQIKDLIGKLRIKAKK